MTYRLVGLPARCDWITALVCMATGAAYLFSPKGGEVGCQGLNLFLSELDFGHVRGAFL
jgi:hypothetical protein